MDRTRVLQTIHRISFIALDSFFLKAMPLGHVICYKCVSLSGC